MLQPQNIVSMGGEEPFAAAQQEIVQTVRADIDYLLIKSPPASGKSRALMFIALDKLETFFQTTDAKSKFFTTDLPLMKKVDQHTDGDALITLTRLNLIDAADAPIEKISEFRNDHESMVKLRRLRLFALANYTEKSQNHIEDHVSSLIYDYETVVKKWNFKTRYSALNTLLNSKSLGVAFAGTIAGLAADAPLISLTSLGGGLIWETSKFALELGKVKFDASVEIGESPVSYIVEANKLLK